jgi:hypothetical protein
MLPILIIGLVLMIFSIAMSFYELMGFFNAVGQLNRFTAKRRSFLKTVGSFLMYPFRLITLLPKLMPVALDAIIMVVCGSIGLNGGTTGAIIGLMASAIASILVRVYRRMNKHNSVSDEDWRLAHTPAEAS